MFFFFWVLDRRGDWLGCWEAERGASLGCVVIFDLKLGIGY